MQDDLDASIINGLPLSRSLLTSLSACSSSKREDSLSADPMWRTMVGRKPLGDPTARLPVPSQTQNAARLDCLSLTCSKSGRSTYFLALVLEEGQNEITKPSSLRQIAALGLSKDHAPRCQAKRLTPSCRSRLGTAMPGRHLPRFSSRTVTLVSATQPNMGSKSPSSSFGTSIQHPLHSSENAPPPPPRIELLRYTSTSLLALRLVKIPLSQGCLPAKSPDEWQHQYRRQCKLRRRP